MLEVMEVLIFFFLFYKGNQKTGIAIGLQR